MKSNKKNMEKALSQVNKRTPHIICELIAVQLDIIDDSIRRITQEGTVVKDLKGSVIPHPSIKIKLDATKATSDLLSKYR